MRSLALSFGFLAAVSLAQSIPLTPELAVKPRRISDLNFSGDAAHLACVISEVKGQTPESHVWMLDVAGNRFRQFTSSTKSEWFPRWAPDSKVLAFLSNRNDTPQIYTMRIDGGEPSALTASQSGVSAFEWSPDGTKVAFLAREPRIEAADPHVADQEQDLDRLWVIDLASKKTQQVTSGSWRISEFKWLTDDQIAAVATHQPAVEAWTDAIYRIAVADGSFNLLAKPNHPFDGLTISPGRNQLAFVAARNGGPIPHDLFLQGTRGGTPRDLTAAIDRRVIDTKWQNDDAAVIRVTDGFFYRLYRVGADTSPALIDLPYSARGFDVTRDGTIAFVAVGFNRLPEIFLRTSEGAIRQVSHVQDAWSNVALADAELFRFKSFDGKVIEAALMKPPVHQNAAKHPLILLVHGGPASNFSADYFWFNAWAQLLAARGYEVLMVNPRGSAGYGEEFVKANRADWGGGDFKDLMAAVDVVVAKGEIDPERMGIGGWSYGGEMAAWAITQTTRFKAAVVGGVVFDQASEFGTEDSSAGDEWYFGTPWEHPEVFARNSPSTYIRNAKTPTLIVHGANDRANPVGQALALYRALKHFNVEAQLVTYPREQHLPREEKHQIDIMQRMLSWFDRHL